MTELFPNKWISREGDICDENGVYTKTFLHWCKKLSKIKPEQYVAAFKLLEERCADAELEGKDYWPPSFAGFIGLCRAKKAHQTYSRYQLPYSPADRKEKGKRGTASLKDLMSGAKIISVEEADQILERAKDDSMKVHHAEWVEANG